MTSGSAVSVTGLRQMAAPMRQMSDARVLSDDRRGTHFWPHRAASSFD
jgi:hypothetical protein